MPSAISLWIEILEALLTPVIAVGALVLGVQNHRLSKRRRQDELFDRRYAFYQRLRATWVGTCDQSVPEPEVEDLVPIAEEGAFLFGEDIEKHVLSLAHSRHHGSPFFPNEAFVEPFRKYLRL